jgi:hypothetical protein
MELGSNSNHQSRLRNESISGRSVKGREHSRLLMTSTAWDWTMTTGRGLLSHLWRAFESGMLDKSSSSYATVYGGISGNDGTWFYGDEDRKLHFLMAITARPS